MSLSRLMRILARPVLYYGIRIFTDKYAKITKERSVSRHGYQRENKTTSESERERERSREAWLVSMSRSFKFYGWLVDRGEQTANIHRFRFLLPNLCNAFSLALPRSRPLSVIARNSPFAFEKKFVSLNKD